MGGPPFTSALADRRLVVLLLFGAGRFSDLMGDVAKGIKSFKKGMAEDDEAERAPHRHRAAARRAADPAAAAGRRPRRRRRSRRPIPTGRA